MSKLALLFVVMVGVFLTGRLQGSHPKMSASQYQSKMLAKIKNSSYDRFVIPHSNGTLLVKTRLYIIRIQEMNQAFEKMQSTLRFQFSWIDPFLKWDPADYGNLSHLVLPSALLWMPDLQIANAVENRRHSLREDDTAFRVQNDGRVWYHPTSTTRTRCKFDLTLFPFDTQRCLIIVESCIYQEDELTLIIRTDDHNEHRRNKAVSLGMYAENEVWDLDPSGVGGVAARYKTGSHTVFSRVHFWIFVRRRSTFYVITLVIPSVMLGVIGMVTFLIPPHYIDRPVVSVTIILAIAIFQSMISEHMPNTSANCLLTMYLTAMLCSTSSTLLITTICLALIDPGEFISPLWGLPNVARWVKAGLLSCRKQRKVRRALQQQQDHLLAAVFLPNAIQAKGFDAYPDRPLVQFDKMDNRQATRLSGHELETYETVVPRHRHERERRLSTGRQFWIIAYVINWTGFVMCLIANLSIPIYAEWRMYHHPAHADHLHIGGNSSVPLAVHYYGD